MQRSFGRLLLILLSFIVTTAFAQDFSRVYRDDEGDLYHFEMQ